MTTPMKIPTIDHRMLEESLERAIRFADDAASTWSALAGLGMLGMAIGTDQGGPGLAFGEIALAARVLGRRGLGVPYRVFEAQSVPLLAELAGDPAVARLFPGVLDSSVRVSLAAPSATHIFAAVCKQGIRIDGQIPFVEGMATASHAIVAAELDGDAALLLVPSGARGLSHRPYAVSRGDPLSDLVLSDVVVPSDACIARGEAARTLLDGAHGRGVLATCAAMVGAMEALLPLTVDHLRTRRQFGRALAEFQVLQHAAADMFVELETAHALLDYGCEQLVAGAPPREGMVDMVKMRINDAARIVGETAVQLHGGIGMTMESAVGRLFATLTEDRNSFGTSRACMARLIAADRGAPQF